MAQSPSAITSFGAGVASKVLRSGVAMFMVTGPGHQQRVGMPRRRHEPDAEPFRVVDRTERRRHLELAAVARAGVDVADLQRTAQPPRRGGDRLVRRSAVSRRFGDPSRRQDLAEEVHTQHPAGKKGALRSLSG